MKKYISVLVCLSLVLSITFSLSMSMGAVAKDDGTTLYIDKVTQAPDLKDPTTWGDPVLVFGEGTPNATVHNYNATVDVNTASLYACWDSRYLYVGLSSPETEVIGSADDETWTGDGIQIRIEKGDSITSEMRDFYITFKKDKTGSHGSYGGYNHSLFVQDGVMYTMIAFPHADFGFEKDEIIPSAEYTFNLLRIIGTNRNVYAGWIALGAFFSLGHDYNKNATGNCHFILRDPANPGAEFNAPVVKSSVSEVTKGSGYSSVNTVLNKNNQPIVKTEDGLFIVYTTKVDIMQAKGEGAYNSFSLQKIEDGVGTELAYAYTQSGSQDLFADEDGVLYIVGGGSSWDVKKLSSYYNYKDSVEKAYLNIWIYKDGFLNGISTQKAFKNPSADGYEYAYATMENGIIKSTYIGKLDNGKYAVETFKFDIAARKWINSDEEPVIVETDPLVQQEISDTFDYNGVEVEVVMDKNAPSAARFVIDGKVVQMVNLSNKITTGTIVKAFQIADSKVALVFDGTKGSTQGWYYSEVELSIPASN